MALAVFWLAVAGLRAGWLPPFLREALSLGLGLELDEEEGEEEVEAEEEAELLSFEEGVVPFLFENLPAVRTFSCNNNKKRRAYEMNGQQ